MLKKDLKKLQSKWYNRLKKEGFKDIEDKNQDHLLEWHSSYFHCRYDHFTFESNAEYYRLASELLHTHRFKTKEQKSIWAYHIEGHSIRLIARKLQMKIWFVHKTIQSLQSMVRCKLA